MDRFNGSPINQDGPFKTWASEPIPVPRQLLADLCCPIFVVAAAKLMINRLSKEYQYELLI